MDELELKERAGKFVYQLYSNNRKTLIELFEAAFTRMADYKARAERAEAERDDLRAQLDAMHRKASNLELELEQSERQRREISDMADKMADKWTLQVEQLRARLDAAQEAAHMPDDWPHGLPSWIAQRLYAAYIGAAFSPDVMEQIRAGRLTFPEAPIYAERDELRNRVMVLERAFQNSHEVNEHTGDEILALRAELAAARAELVLAGPARVYARCCHCDKPARIARTYYDSGFPSAREHLCPEHADNHPWHGTAIPPVPRPEPGIGWNDTAPAPGGEEAGP